MKKVKNIVIMLINAALVLTICGVSLLHADAAYYVYFTVINDNILPLVQEDMPVSLNGVTYVPYTIFHSTELGTSVYYSSTLKTVQVVDGVTSVRFDLSKMTTTDGNGKDYKSLALTRNGKPYLPAKFVCEMYGLNYVELATGLDYPLIRISNSTAKLSNDEVVSRGYERMKSRLEEYLVLYPPPVETARPQYPVVTEPPDNSNIKVYLVFQSAAYCEEILAALEGNQAIFYLTADEIRENDNFVRELIGTHRPIGIYADVEGEGTALAYLREVAAIKTDYILDALPTPMTIKTATSKLEAARKLVLLNLRADENNIEQIIELIDNLQESKYNISEPDESVLGMLEADELL